MIPIIDEDLETILNEMAQIGCIGPYQIYVRTNDAGQIPHFHVWDLSTNGQKFHTCIRIDKPEYFHHTGKEGVLNSKSRKLLVSFLEGQDEFEDSTRWKVLVKEWNRNNSKVKIDPNTPMPDYTKL